jgi:putative solute:sodium symporter small subunit
MLEKKRRRPYWRDTKLQAIRSLLLPGAVIASSPFWVGRLDGLSFIGYPLGYFALAFAAVVLVVVAAARFVLRQDDIDHWNGAQEDI